jgi:hypothetical protein
MRTQLAVGSGLAVVVAVLMAGTARAERPSQQVLEEMGLSGLRVMSDSAALAIRGSGWRRGRSSSSASAWGKSSAEFNLPFDLAEAETDNGYNARGRHYASGRNGSSASIEIKLDGGLRSFHRNAGGNLTVKVKLSAHGYSSARAH